MAGKRVYYNQKILKHADLFLKANGSLMVFGPPGSGKTYLGLYLAEKDGYQLEILAGKESLRDEDMIGTFRIVDGSNAKWIDGPLTRAFRRAANGEKVMLIVDEITRIPTRYLNIFIEVMNNYDPDNYVFYNHITGETLRAPRENLVIFATANVNQVGTNEIPEALLDRFASYLYVDFPSMEEELKILKHHGLSDETAQVLVRFAHATRRMHEDGVLEFPVSTRCLVTLARGIRNVVKEKDFDREIRVGMELLKGQMPYLTGSVTGNTEWEETANALLELYLNVYQEVYEEVKQRKVQKKTNEAGEPKAKESKSKTARTKKKGFNALVI